MLLNAKLTVFCAAATVAGRLQSRNATIDAEGCDAKHGGGE